MKTTNLTILSKLRLNFQRIIGLLLFIYSTSHSSFAQAPGWSVTPADFQFTMTVKAVLNINGEISSDGNDLVAAFVGGQVRGVGSPTVFIPSLNQYQVFMTVYANTEGEAVTFKIYDNSTNTQYNAVNASITFSSGATFGNPDAMVISTNNSPTNITLSNSSIAENSAINTTVGSLSTTDPDNGDTHTYTLVEGEGSTDNANFNILGNALRNSAVFNFEQKSSYSIRIRTTDQRNGFFEKVFTINVTDVNEAPTNISLSEVQVEENKPVGTIIGTFTTTDQDNDETHTYSFSNAGGLGTDNGSFTINGNQLRSAIIFDFETKNSYDVQVMVTDKGGLTFTKQFTIQILDVNDAPTAMSLAPTSVEENRPIGTEVGVFSTIDQDAGETFTYTLYNPQNTNDNSSFTIDGNKLHTFHIFDYEAKNTYVIYVQVADSKGAILQKSFQITVINVNEAPNTLSISSTSVLENAPTGTLVGTFSSTDPDGDTNFTYSLVAGAGDVNNASFAIDGSTLVTAASFDFETKNAYQVRVRVSDANGLFFERTFNIAIIDANDTPTNINLSANTIGENKPIGTVIGNLQTVDQDATDTHLYTLVAGAGSDDNASFKIIGNALQSDAVFDFETKNQYTVRIMTDDKRGGTFEKAFSITILDLNDAPTALALSSNSIDENAPVNTVIGTFSTTDVDAGDVHSYTLEQFADFGSFIIDGNTLKARFSFDFENKSSYSIRVRTTDKGGSFFIQDFTVVVVDVNEVPTDITLSNVTINENELIGTRIGFLGMVDPDGGESPKFSLVQGFNADDNASFTVGGNSLEAKISFDFETKSTHLIRIEAEDKGGLKFSKWFTITVLDVNDKPTDIRLTQTRVGENQPIGTGVGLLSSIDQDKDDTHSYSLVTGEGDTDNTSFRIVENALQTNSVFNFEVKPLQTIRIRTTDKAGAFFDKVFTISIDDRNDPPTDILLSNASIDENKPIGSVVGTFATIDEDANDTYTYAVEAHADGALFYADGNSLKTKVVFDFEARDTYAIRVRSTDKGGLSTTKDFVIKVLDANDPPSNIFLSGNVIDENLPLGTFIGELSATDQDANEAFTYALVAGIGGADNASFRIEGNQLQSNVVFDFETKSSYSLRIEVTDRGGAKFSKSFTVTIIDKNDSPTDISLSSNTIGENIPTGTFIGRFATTDQDANDQHTFALVAGTGSTDNASFRIVGNELQSDRVFDFELKNRFTIRVRTTDKLGASFEKVFEVVIIDRNDPPTDIEFIDPPSVVSGSAIGTFVGRMRVIDQDANDTHRYELFGGSDGVHNSVFRITGDELFTNAVLPEQPDLLKISVRVTDKENSQFTKSFVVRVIPSNKPPVAVDQSFQVMENAGRGSQVGILAATDPDLNQVLQFQILNLQSFDHTFPFVLQANGQLIVEKPEFLDILWRDQWQFGVRVTDNGTPRYHTDFVVTVNMTHVPGESLPFNNYISPNGDNRNDYLVIQHLEKYPNNSLAIYDNTGQQVYFTTNYQNDWVGMSNGKLLPTGSYVMVFKNESSGKVYRTTFTLVNK